jgi:hypothetical protein
MEGPELNRRTQSSERHCNPNIYYAEDHNFLVRIM